MNLFLKKMNLNRKNKLTNNIKISLVSLIIVIISTVFFINFFNYSKNKLQPVLQQKRYGFYVTESLDDKLNFNWMSDYESLLRIRIASTKIAIPIFCYKPNINDDPIRLKIYIDEKLIYNNNINHNNLIYLKINLEKLGYKKDINQIIDIKFKIDKLWSPGGQDKRMLGVAVGEVVFLE